MEQKLKRQRNRLFLRVTLILLAVWLVVSATYCAIRLYSEKSSIRNQMLTDLSYVQQTVYGEPTDEEIVDTLGYLLYQIGREYGWNSQFVILDAISGGEVENTEKKIGVEFGMFISAETSRLLYGILDYNTVRNSLTDEQFGLTDRLLNEERADGRDCELVCTRFQLVNNEIVPVELKITLNEGEGSWFMSDEILETFDIGGRADGGKIYSCNQMKRNVIPKDFLFKGNYGRELMSAFTDEELKGLYASVMTAPFEYIFYTSDYLYYGASSDGEDIVSPVNRTPRYEIRYAKKVNLLETCLPELLIGDAVIFSFFLIIAVILCVMIWKMVKSQMIQEKKRADFTNALAHDIKTPLFVISGYAYSLKEDIDADERGLYVDKIIEQTDEINGMVHNMLELSKLDSCAVTLNKTEFDLGALTEEILDGYKKLPGGRTAVFTQSGVNTILADRELVKTALHNLIENAAKYSLPETEIRIEVADGGFSIANQCEKLSKSELKQLWQPYYRKDKSRHQNGNGLGLSIVKSVFDLHGIKYDMRMSGSTLTISAKF